MTQTDKAFTGSIPALYDRYLGPLLFEPYAADMAARVAALAPAAVLETAAGTGIVTKRLAETLPKDTSITVTDLNQAMLDVAATKVPARKIEWRACDATRLPFADGSFDAVVCQFGVMFFPDKIEGYREARRVLRPGGKFLFNVWDRIEQSPISETVLNAVAALYPSDPPGFLRRTPHGYYDVEAIGKHLREAGFGDVESVAVTFPSRAASPRDPAVGFCQGSPLRAEIEARDPTGLEAGTEAAAAAVAARFGSGAIESTIRAFVFTAAR